MSVILIISFEDSGSSVIDKEKCTIQRTRREPEVLLDKDRGGRLHQRPWLMRGVVTLQKGLSKNIESQEELATSMRSSISGEVD